MSTMPTTLTVHIGLPLDELPTHLGGPGRPADHWAAVAEACRRTPNQWRAITIDGLSLERHNCAAKDIRRGTLAAFRDGDWDAALRRGVLYIRYLGEAAAVAHPAFVVVDEAEQVQ